MTPINLDHITATADENAAFDAEVQQHEKIRMTKPTHEWTDWAEAIAFVSATLGEPFITAQGNGLYWGTFARREDDGTRGHTVGLERVGADEVEVDVRLCIADGSHADWGKLYAIIGWAIRKKHRLNIQ